MYSTSCPQKFIMEGTITDLVMKSIDYYVQKMLNYAPVSVEINSLTETTIEPRTPSREQLELGLGRDHRDAGVFLMEMKITGPKH